MRSDTFRVSARRKVGLAKGRVELPPEEEVFFAGSHQAARDWIFENGSHEYVYIITRSKDGQKTWTNVEALLYDKIKRCWHPPHSMGVYEREKFIHDSMMARR